MSNFNDFKEPLQKQYAKMCSSELFVTDIDKDIMWETYLDSFPEGTNEKFRERRAYDCQCCKQFIRACGNVVSVVDGKLVSIWDFKADGYYQVVADAMSKLVKSKPIKNVFRHYENDLGTDRNQQLLASGEITTWDHFYFKLPNKFVVSKDSIGTRLSDFQSRKDVFKRGLEEISLEAFKIVKELIGQGSIYRGEEFKGVIDDFTPYTEAFLLVREEDKDNFCWEHSTTIGHGARLRNTAIGTLLVDISNGVELEHAVHSFGSKMDGYKRPKSIATKGMIEKAEKEITELGFLSALERRHSVVEDLTINNVLHANRTAKKAMNVFDVLKAETVINMKTLEKVEEVSIDTFIKTILPKAETIELLFENRHTNNLVSLFAPKIPDSKNMLKWGNNFCWGYNGEVADSMREIVRSAGGKVDNVDLRYSILWNEKGDNNIDFDAHSEEPGGNLIYYRYKRGHSSSGTLDVDIMSPGVKVAVENIRYTCKTKMRSGRYKFMLHNFSSRPSNSGFRAEIEFGGNIYSYEYNRRLRGNEKVTVAVVDYDKKTGEFKIIESLPSAISTKEVWGIPTNQMHKVSLAMYSPNHWDGEETGNKHYFFILDNCKNPDPARGFFNEFLHDSLTPHRKVFEMLGSKMRVEPSDNQLSGLGFSSTQRNSVFCKVTGSFTRTIKINF